MPDIRSNLLYFGDNLNWLRDKSRFPDESVDLTYLDPPFNSNRNYNVLFKESDVRESEAQMHAFEDTWKWSQDVQEVADEFWLTAPEKPQQMLKSMIAALGRNDVTAYLTMMAPRLVELHRTLKATGSLYLHCDPTASHYLKALLDSIFSPRNFQNEVIWKRTSAHNSGRKFGPVHDILLFYTKSAQANWNPQMRPLDESYEDSHYSNLEDERRYKRQDLTGAGIRHGATGEPWRGINPTLKGRHWMRPPAELDKWDAEGRIYSLRSPALGRI